MTRTTTGCRALTSTSRSGGTRKARLTETLAICRSLELARAVFAAAIAEKPMIRSRMWVVRRRALSISSIRLQISLYERGDGGFDEVSADLLCSGWRVALR
jgi:hypothetical protein